MKIISIFHEKFSLQSLNRGSTNVIFNDILLIYFVV